MMDQMIIERDVSIPTSDGITLKADVFRPKDGKPAPVIMTLGPYGKGVHYKDGYTPQWEWLIKTHPDILPGSTRSLMTWETVDPETWVPWGYVCIRVDSRGAGRSPGYLDIFSPRETRDYYEAIEWAGVQPWSNGKVGLNGISYYAINQWLVASLQPPHLAAMIPWEGAADVYRDWSRHGGILSNVFTEMWYNRQVVSIQHGNADAIIDPWLNDRASGPPSSLLDKEQLERNRSDPVADALHHPLDDDFYRQRSPDFSKITVPFLSAANWAGFGLHERGNFEAFTQAASKQKWLECHPGRHEEWFYLKEGINIQKRFLDYFLKGVDNGWDKQPPVLLRLRRPFSEQFEVRHELTWPLPDTKWTPRYFSASDKLLSWSAPEKESSVSFSALQDAVTFTSAPLEHATELTGPLAAKIYASSTTTDMDLFITLQAFAPDGREVEFQGTVDPHTPLAQGWLRASHRKLDPACTLPHRPYHSHDEIQPLEPNQVYELDVEIWPTNILLPVGYRLAIQVGGKDFERTDSSNDGNEAWITRGSGPWLHTHPDDRPKEIFGGITSIYGGGSRASYVLLPVIESR